MRAAKDEREASKQDGYISKSVKFRVTAAVAEDEQ